MRLTFIYHNIHSNYYYANRSTGTANVIINYPNYYIFVCIIIYTYEIHTVYNNITTFGQHRVIRRNSTTLYVYIIIRRVIIIVL